MADNIYDYLKENFNIETDYKFKRDYIKNPLYIAKNGYGSEVPYKEDLEYLYIKLNLMRKDILKIFNVSLQPFARWITIYNIRKDKKLIKENIDKSLLLKYPNGNPTLYGSSGFKELMIKKYNVDNYAKTKVRRNQLKDKKYYKKINAKSFLSKKNNGTLGKSKEEDEIYKLLKEKYPDTIHHYKSKLYPFPCDFYVPKLDLYIEYQGFYMHGKEPYIGTEKQKEKVKVWKNKKSIQYKRAIDTWTRRDPLKRETAKKNNLNWLEFFSMKEFTEWYNKNIFDIIYFI